jgi:glucose/mannose-6-phosphate isomerase
MSASMLEDVLDIPNHIRDAIWRIDSARLEPCASAGFMVCGMGGSAIGGELARGLLGERLTGPLVVVRSYRLPRWVTSGWSVLGSSYSGDTEETFSAFEEAGQVGAHRWVVGTGGKLGEYAREHNLGFVGLPGYFQPRVTVAYMTVAAALAANLAGVAPDVREEFEATADFLDQAKDGLQELATELAQQMDGMPLVVHGVDLTVPIARRWANQVNENSKQFAFAAEIPEANHNLMEAWAAGDGGLGAVFLLDRDQTPRERQRTELTAESVARTGASAVTVDTQGETPSERLFWAVMLGDLISIKLAEQRGMDPLPVNEIVDFKKRLGAH